MLRPLFALLLLAPLNASSQSEPPKTPVPPSPTPATDAQKAKVKAGLVSVPLVIREEYLGRSGAKTVTRFTLTLDRADLKRGNPQPRVYSFFLTADVKSEAGNVIDTFRVPVDVDLSGEPKDAAKIVFLQALLPGSLTIAFQLEGVAGRAVGTSDVKLNVPTMSSEFTAEAAGKDASGLPSAAAVILEGENRPIVPPGESGFVQIIEPKKEVPIGLIRIECEVKAPVTRVEFYLEDKKILVKNRPPYTVELDLGKIPKKQTLKAIGFDKQGNYIDADAWAINERDARLAVRILELPAKPGADGSIELKVALQSIAGGVAKSMKLYLDTELVRDWPVGGPYTATVSAAKLKKATLLRATAVDEEGKEFSDIKLLRGEQRFVSRVEVNLVELNVSVFDAEGKFVKGLKREDVTVLEDGQPQTLGTFDYAESLPLSLGVVIDGSGSMKDSMPLVHQAATEFIEKLILEKDQGFVMEFREQPILLASMTKRAADLTRAVRESRAVGGTALYDSVVMALYQFRSVPGKKAIVVLTDGKDNRSWTDYDTLRRYARAAGVPIYFIGLDISFLDVGLKAKLREIAADTGADAFFIGKAVELPAVYKRIESELRSQYFMNYLTESKKPEDQFRAVEVRMKDPKLRAKTIRGYFP